MYISCFEEVHGDFVVIRDGADDVGANVLLIVEGFNAAPNANVLVV